MNLEEAIAITLAFPGGVVVKRRPSKEDQEVIDWARQFVRANALDAIAATRKAWLIDDCCQRCDMGRHPKATAGSGSAVDESAPFLRAKNLKPFISEELERSSQRQEASAASNLNENNISTLAPEPFDFEQQGICLAEHAARWSGDWCDFADMARQSLAAAYAHGLQDAGEIVLRTERVDSAGIRDRFAEILREQLADRSRRLNPEPRR